MDVIAAAENRLAANANFALPDGRVHDDDDIDDFEFNSPPIK